MSFVDLKISWDNMMYNRVTLVVGTIVDAVWDRQN